MGPKVKNNLFVVSLQFNPLDFQSHALILIFTVGQRLFCIIERCPDICDGKLLFVSDKHDHVIFELLLEPGIARTKTFLDLRNIPEPPKSSFPINERLTRKAGELSGYSGGFDWEGLTCDKQGNFYLVSEYFLQC